MVACEVGTNELAFSRWPGGFDKDELLVLVFRNEHPCIVRPYRTDADLAILFDILGSDQPKQVLSNLALVSSSNKQPLIKAQANDILSKEP